MKPKYDGRTVILTVYVNTDESPEAVQAKFEELDFFRGELILCGAGLFPNGPKLWEGVLPKGGK